MGNALSVENAAPYVLVMTFILVYRIVVWIFKPSIFSTTVPVTNSPAIPLSKVSEIPWSNELTFVLNGTIVKLINPDPSELLATYIRDKAGLKGTKLGCEEGGCGACTVVLTKPGGTLSVNSCLRPLCTNDGMAITTVEGIGAISSGLSCEQTSIVNHNGTQCGYCTPGWISNMHARNLATEEGSMPAISGGAIDQYFDGNICRCTGYKPILAAFKESAATTCGGDGSCKTTGVCSSTGEPSCHTSIEDIGSKRSHNATQSCTRSTVVGKKSTPLNGRGQLVKLGAYVAQPLHFYNLTTNTHWYRPIDVSQLCALLQQYQSIPAACIQFVGGNTSIGVTKYFNDSAPYNSQDKYSVFVDVNSIPEMCEQTYDPVTKTLRAGATTTLTELITLLTTNANKPTDSDIGVIDHHSAFSVTAHHLRRIANTQVRNTGTWAGNLGIFKRHTSFPSDAVLAFTTSDAVLSVCKCDNFAYSVTEMRMSEFLQSASLRNIIILSVAIKECPPFTPTPGALNTYTESFKICVREHNAHAQLNAGFSYDIVHDVYYKSHGPLCNRARVVFGGVSKKTFIATRCEEVLHGFRVNSKTLQRALEALEQDLAQAGISTGYGSQVYRHSVMQSCLYRSLLRCYNRLDIPKHLVSVLDPFVKPQSRGTEVYHVDDRTAPIATPVPKLESKAQTTGEAVYPSDEPIPPQGLCGAIVFTSQCGAVLTAIDTSTAMALPGVVTFIGADAIPGSNLVGSDIPLYLPIGAEVQYIGAPVGVVLATSDEIANQAASLIQLSYSSLGKTPIVSLPQAITARAFFDVPETPYVTIIESGDPIGAMQSAPRRVKGTVLATGQSHFYMEAQSSVATLIDGDVLEVTCGTQDPTVYQGYIASALGVNASKVVVKCLRTGGGFGGKLTGGITTALSTALASSVVKRPVRIFNTRTADMYMNSGREGYSFNYEIGFDTSGKVLALTYDIYCDAGVSYSDAFGGLNMAMMWADNAFYLPNYLARAKLCYTNTPPRTYARAPGVVQSCLVTGIIMDRVACELGLDVATVKQKNFLQDGQPTILGQPIVDSTLNRCWNTLLHRSNYADRLVRVQQFNAQNTWRKRGISIDPVKYGIGWAYYNAGCHIGIFRSDGTVTVTHSGCEVGQGINTKVAQVVAAALHIDLSVIRVSGSSTDRIANGGTTGGSGTSEVCCEAALKACRVINAAIHPYKSKYPDVSWQDLLGMLPPDVSLNADGWYSPPENPNKQDFQYFVWGACVSEVELDVLSGMVNVLSSEIVYDCGRSLNPSVDIGQIEGGFVMGLGYFLQERIDYDDAGLLESVGTWEYKPPLAQDIPSVFNVTLLAGAPNKAGILRSKAVGEPCIVLANSVYFAVKAAIDSARIDAGVHSYCTLNAPMTIDVRQEGSLVSPARFDMPL